jgi:hypothetical protein
MSVAGNTAGQSTFSGTNIVIGGGANITLSGVNATRFDIVGGAGAAGNTGSISAGTTRGTLGEMVFSNSNGISFGIDGQTLTAQHNALTTARASNDAVGLATAQSNVTWTVNSAGLSLDARGYAGTATTFNGANLSGSMTVNSAGVNLSLSAGNYLTTARASNDAIGLNTAQSNVTWTVNSAGLSLDARGYAGTGTTFNGANISGSLTVNSNGVQVSASVATSLSNIRVSAGTTSNLLSAVTFADGNGVSFGLNAGTVTGSHNGLTSQSNQNVTASNGGFAFQTLSFSNANGLSFGTSAGSAIIASYTVPTVTNSSWTVSDNASSATVARLAFTNLNGVTLSLSTGANGSHTIVGSHNALTSQSNQAFSAAGGSSAFQTLGFSDTNGVSFSNSNGSVVATVRTNYASSVHGHTLSAFAVSNTTQSSSGTIDMANVSFAGAGGVSVGVSNGSVVISAAAGGGGTTNQTGPNIGVSNLGNTAGSTGTVSTGNVVLVGAGGITLSQSTGAVGSDATVTIQGDAKTISSLLLQPFAGMAAGIPFAQSSISLGQNSLYLYPFQLEDHLTVDHAKIPVMVTHSSSAAASVQKGYTYRLGLYSYANSTQLSQLYSTSHTMAASHNSNASWMVSMITAIGNSTSYNTLSASSAGLNLSASLHGPREFILPISTLLTPGQYVVALAASTSSVGAGGSILNLSNIVVAVQTFNRPGLSTNTTNRAFYNDAGMGLYSTTTGAMPASIGMTQINQNGTQPLLFLGSGTV